MTKENKENLRLRSLLCIRNNHENIIVIGYNIVYTFTCATIKFIVTITGYLYL